MNFNKTQQRSQESSGTDAEDYFINILRTCTLDTASQWALTEHTAPPALGVKNPMFKGRLKKEESF